MAEGVVGYVTASLGTLGAAAASRVLLAPDARPPATPAARP